jgi:hypothetical protein
MTTTIPALEIRRRLGRGAWASPQPFGPDGWYFAHHYRNGGIIISTGPAADDEDCSRGDWWHASISWADGMPSYWDLAVMHRAIWPTGYAYQVFAPPSAHVNIHPNALHLWGRPDGSIQLPDFGQKGII